MTPLHVRLHEWSNTNLAEEVWRALRDRELEGTAARALARRLTDARIVGITELRSGLEVRSFAHVGRVQIGDLVITITPKINSTDLLRLVRYAFDLHDVRLLAPTDFAKGDELLPDLLIAQLVAEARELLSRGLARRYALRSESLASPRGRIDVGALARRAAVHRADLPCIHHPRSSDTPLNRSLGAGLHLAGRLATAPLLRSAARQTAAWFDAVATPCRLDRSALDAARRSLDRLATDYEPALTIIELLYEGSTLSLGDGDDVAVPGCLFDMNRFFQALVTRLLADHLEDCSVKPEFALRDMMAFDPERNPRNRRSPRPRPDLAISRGQRVVQLLDAKYRDLWERDLPRDMLYQLTIYAMSQRDATTAAIIYPALEARARAARVEIRDPMTSTARAWVELRPLVLPRLARLLDATETEDSRREISRLVASLALGEVTRASSI
jgi:5-methylcytosine-specific restriction enzyme subunit McrC